MSKQGDVMVKYIESEIEDLKAQVQAAKESGNYGLYMELVGTALQLTLLIQTYKAESRKITLAELGGQNGEVMH